MGVASWLLILLGLLMGPGQSGVLALTEGWVTVPSCTVVWGGWLPGAWCRKHAHCWWAAAAVVVVVVGWLVGASVRACVRVGVACCRGSGAVRPGCLACLGLLVVLGVLGGCGWVGCELYSGREHLTVRFLRQMFLVLSCVLLFVFLSVRWMPWHQGPMKDVVACDKPRGAG